MRSALVAIFASAVVASAAAQDLADQISAQQDALEDQVANEAAKAEGQAAGPAPNEIDRAMKAADSDADQVRPETPPTVLLPRSGSSHSESSSSSSSSSFSVGIGVPAADGPSGSGAAALNGTWKLANGDGSRTCDIRLSGGEEASELHSAWVPTGCPDGFLSANSWRYSRGALDVTDRFGEVFGTFQRRGRDRFEGSNPKSGERLVLSR